MPQGWPGWRRAAEEALSNAPSKALRLALQPSEGWEG